MSDAVTVTIFALLASDSVTALVGKNINPDTAGVGMPSIAVYMVTDSPFQGLAGPTATWTGRVSVQIRAGTADERYKINGAVRAALSGLVGVFQGSRCRFWKAGSDVSRWSDDGSVAEQVTDWYVSYSAVA